MACSSLIDVERAVSAWNDYFHAHEDVLTYTRDEAALLRSTFQPKDMRSFLAMLVSDDAVSRKQSARTAARDELDYLADILNRVYYFKDLEALPELDAVSG